MMKIKSQLKDKDGVKLTEYDDGSYEIRCSKCDKMDIIKPDSKQANLILQIGDKVANDWKCINCFLEGNTPPNPQDTIQDNIRWGQSWNLAVAIVAPMKIDMEETKKLIEEWQRYFHKKLKGQNK